MKERQKLLLILHLTECLPLPLVVRTREQVHHNECYPEV